MKSLIAGIIIGIGSSLIFAGIISANDDKIIEQEKRKANKWRDKYWEGNRQIALYDDEVKQLKKIIKTMTEKIR